MWCTQVMWRSLKTNLETVAACSFDPANKCLTGLITEVCGSCQPLFSVLCLLFPPFNTQITTYGKKITYDFLWEVMLSTHKD